MVVFSHDDDEDDTIFHMSDIPLQLPASAKFPSNGSALATFSQAGSDPMQNVHSIRPIPSQTRVKPWQSQYLDTYPQKCTSSSWTSGTCAVGFTNELEKL